MDDVQSLWEPRASQDDVTLMVSYEGDTELAAVIDGVRVKQLFNNLIGNALKFARNGVVEAGLKASGRTATTSGWRRAFATTGRAWIPTRGRDFRSLRPWLRSRRRRPRSGHLPPDRRPDGRPHLGGKQSRPRGDLRLRRRCPPQPPIEAAAPSNVESIGDGELLTNPTS
jgi:hypothetical protein